MGRDFGSERFEVHAPLPEFWFELLAKALLEKEAMTVRNSEAAEEGGNSKKPFFWSGFLLVSVRHGHGESILHTSICTLLQRMMGGVFTKCTEDDAAEFSDESRQEGQPPPPDPPACTRLPRTCSRTFPLAESDTEDDGEIAPTLVPADGGGRGAAAAEEEPSALSVKAGRAGIDLVSILRGGSSTSTIPLLKEALIFLDLPTLIRAASLVDRAWALLLIARDKPTNVLWKYVSATLIVTRVSSRVT